MTRTWQKTCHVQKPRLGQSDWWYGDFRSKRSIFCLRFPFTASVSCWNSYLNPACKRAHSVIPGPSFLHLCSRYQSTWKPQSKEADKSPSKRFFGWTSTPSMWKDGFICTTLACLNLFWNAKFSTLKSKKDGYHNLDTKISNFMAYKLDNSLQIPMFRDQKLGFLVVSRQRRPRKGPQGPGDGPNDLNIHMGHSNWCL